MIALASYLLCICLFLLSHGSTAFVPLLAGDARRVTSIGHGRSWQTGAAPRKSVTWQQPPGTSTVLSEIGSASPVSPIYPSYAQDRQKTLLFGTRRNRLRSPRVAGRISRITSWLRKVTRTLLLAAFLAFSFQNPAWSVTGGRMGGSFKPSSSSRSSSPSSSSMRSRPAPSTRVYVNPRPPIRVYNNWGWRPRGYGYPTRVYNSVSYETPVRGFSPTDVAVLTGTGVLLAYGFTKSRDDSDSSDLTSALGPGVSVASITVAMDVPNRDDPSCILSRLKRISQGANTGTRRGVQTLVSNVALELMRQEKSINSAKTLSKHFSSASDAEREFTRLSVQERSKFEGETVNKYGGIDIGQAPTEPDDAFNDKATAAVVTISLSIQGDRTKLPQIRSRKDLTDALSRIAADAPVEDCLLSAEVLWAPEARSDRLTDEDVFADHPSLYPL